MILILFLLGGTNKHLGLSKTLFTGKLVGSDEHGNKYYQNKKMNVGLFTQKILNYENYL